MVRKNKSSRKAVLLGSKTAKAGFKNEDFIINEFNNWTGSDIAKESLIKMGYVLKEIKNVFAIKIHGYKTDVQIEVIVITKRVADFQNLQVKLVSNESSGGNQIDKRWLDKYKEMWDIPEDVLEILKLYTGEKKHDRLDTRDKRRLFLDEVEESDKDKILKFFSENKILVLNDIIKGRGKFAAEWIMVINKKKKNSKKVLRWCILPINKVINYFNKGRVEITNRGNLKIGKVTGQRKGGDGGRTTSQMLQFKINPLLCFEIA
jgi:hypothetical protein